MTTPIVYLTSHFPVIRETFIAREVIELERRGIDVLIVPMVSDPQAVDARDLPRAQVLYLPLVSPAVLAGAIAEFARHPVRALRAIVSIELGLMRRPRRLIRFLAILPKSMYLARRFRRSGVRHIHAHWATVPTTCALVISRLEDIPFTFSAHAWDIFVDGNDLLLSAKIAAAQRVFTCTRHNAEYLSRFGPAHKIEAMYHGIDIDRYAFVEERPAGTPLVFAGGSLTAQKGLDDVVRALARVRDGGVDFRAEIFGEGPARRSLERLIAELGLRDVVTLTGTASHTDVIARMQRARVFAMASHRAVGGFSDGLPNVVAEAMACGAVVVATDYSGIPELIENHVTGLLVPPEDPSMLAGALTRALTDDGLCATLRRGARDRVVEKFDITRNIRPLVDYFEQVLARPGRG